MASRGKAANELQKALNAWMKEFRPDAYTRLTKEHKMQDGVKLRHSSLTLSAVTAQMARSALAVMDLSDTVISAVDETFNVDE